jgi:hypothetical protein
MPSQPKKENYHQQGRITKFKRGTNTIGGNRSSAYTHNDRCQVRTNISLGVTQHSRTQFPRLRMKISLRTRNQPLDRTGTMDIRRLAGTTPSQQGGTTAATTTTNQTHHMNWVPWEGIAGHRRDHQTLRPRPNLHSTQSKIAEFVT